MGAVVGFQWVNMKLRGECLTRVKSDRSNKSTGSVPVRVREMIQSVLRGHALSHIL